MGLFKILLILISLGTTVYCQDSVSIVKFKDLSVEIQSLTPLDKGKLNTVFNIEAEFTADIGETLEGSSIVIKSSKYENIEIYEAVETSLTISWEGPHCDLIEWKHHVSEWKKLTEYNANVFRAFSFDQDEFRKFPKVTLEAVREAVRQHCGEEWVKQIKDIKSLYDAPCDVGESSYFLKIKATDRTSGSKIERLIKILVPMGC